MSARHLHIEPALLHIDVTYNGHDLEVVTEYQPSEPGWWLGAYLLKEAAPAQISVLAVITSKRRDIMPRLGDDTIDAIKELALLAIEEE